MKKLNICSLALALALTVSLAVPVLAADPPGFSDVPASHTFYSGIMDCANKGITSGYGDGTFKPGNTVTRSNFTVMLSRAFYANEVAMPDNQAYASEGKFMPNYMTLYFYSLLIGTSFEDENSLRNPSVMNKGISRYDMAQLITNIMSQKNFAASEAEKSATIAKISDYNSIPENYKNAVTNVYALGIIGGYADGSFKGNITMNRGQAAAIIYRVTQRANIQTPVTPPVTDTKPVEQTPTMTTPVEQTPATSSAKTLRNGQPITEENVLAVLAELKAKYPEHADFANGYTKAMRNSIGGGTSIDVNTVVNKYDSIYGGPTSTTSGCGGWAAFVSDYIFGTSGLSARKISLSDARPGDICIHLTNEGKEHHVSVLTSRSWHNDVAEAWEWSSTDGRTAIGGDNTLPYFVTWKMGGTTWDILQPGDYYCEIWTRYPADITPSANPISSDENSSVPIANTESSDAAYVKDQTPAPVAPNQTKTSSSNPINYKSDVCDLCGQNSTHKIFNDDNTKCICLNCYRTDKGLAYIRS